MKKTETGFLKETQMKTLGLISILCTSGSRFSPRIWLRPLLSKWSTNQRTVLILILGLGFLIPAHPPQAAGSFSGVYTGTITGSFDNGEFALLVRPDNSAMVLFYDALDETGGDVINLTIDNNGNFSFVLSESPFDTVSGQISGNNVSGSVCCAEPATIVGTRSSDSGPLQDAGGVYSGPITGSGTEDGTAVTFDGQIHIIIDAPGNMMVYANVDVFVNGVFQEIGQTGGTVLAAANGTFNGTFMDGVMFNGSINLGNLTAAGNWSFTDPTTSVSGPWNASRSEALPVSQGQTNIDLTGVTDVSGDAVPDIAGLSQQLEDRPRVRYYSGANRKKFKQVGYLSSAWNAIASATVTDSNQDGVANDPAVAVLGRHSANSKLFVQIRRSDNGTSIAGISFLSAAWTPVDLVVIDDVNGDGVSNDTAIGVLGINPARSFRQRNLLQVRRLSDGGVVSNIYFANGAWVPLAVGAVQRTGASPLLAVLVEKPSKKQILVQARVLSDSSLQRNSFFLNKSWRAKDLGILRDTNGNSVFNDASYMVLAVNPGNGTNVVQIRRPGGAFVKNIFVLNDQWQARRLSGADDISGNQFEEIGVLANKLSNGQALIQLKDFSTETTTGGISP